MKKLAGPKLALRKEMVRGLGTLERRLVIGGLDDPPHSGDKNCVVQAAPLKP